MPITLGRYLQRNVQYAELHSIEDLEQIGELENSVVFFWIAKENFGNTNIRNMLENIVRKKPLAIHVCGHRTDSAFATLLGILSIDQPSGTHIMSYHSNGDEKECLQDCFYATVPAEQHFEDWKGISILHYGHDLNGILIAEARKFLAEVPD